MREGSSPSFGILCVYGGVIGNSKGSCPLAVGSNPAYPFFNTFFLKMAE